MVNKDHLDAAAEILLHEGPDSTSDAGLRAKNIIAQKEAEVSERAVAVVKPGSFTHLMMRANGKNKHSVIIECVDCGSDREVYTSDVHQVVRCEECRIEHRRKGKRRAQMTLEASYKALGLTPPDDVKRCEVCALPLTDKPCRHLWGG